MPHIFVEHGMLKAIGMQMPFEGVGDSNVFALRPFFVVGVFADIADEEIEQAVIVVIEKKRAGGVSGEAKPGFLRNVGEVAMPVILEQGISAENDRDEKIRGPIIVDVGESRAHADTSG